MKKTSIIVLLLLAAMYSFGQNNSLNKKHTITGYVESAESGEKLAGASVYITEMPSIGTITNTYGFYSLTIPENMIKLTVSYTGYAAQIVQIDLRENQHINFSLKQETNILGGKNEK